jgi:hypothetical protein
MEPTIEEHQQTLRISSLLHAATVRFKQWTPGQRMAEAQYSAGVDEFRAFVLALRK